MKLEVPMIHFGTGGFRGVIGDDFKCEKDCTGNQ